MYQVVESVDPLARSFLFLNSFQASMAFLVIFSMSSVVAASGDSMVSTAIIILMTAK
uniref:Uncharacterized protein n=1 Tax=Arundo donax TaxID=35708 RepID=A0A0A9GBV7_ARUDO